MAKDYVVRVAMLGDQAVGKTCIIERFVNEAWVTDTSPTVAAAFKTKPIASPRGTFTIRFNIWDTAGQETFKSVASFYYKDADAIILVYDVTQPKSLESLAFWLDEVKQHASPYCLLTVMGNKIDLVSAGDHDLTKAQSYAKSIHASYFISSAKNNFTIKDAYMELAIRVCGEDAR